MFRRVIKYSIKHFSLFKDIENITDGRQNPQIYTTDTPSLIISMLFSNLGLLNLKVKINSIPYGHENSLA
jgi:hypothetical protein